MEDGLSRPWTYIENGAISIFDAAVASDLRRHQVAAAYGLGVFGSRFLQTTNVFFWNDQNVCRGLWINVFERIGVRVLEDFLGRHLTTDNAAEETIFH